VSRAGDARVSGDGRARVSGNGPPAEPATGAATTAAGADALARLRDLLREEGGVIATLVRGEDGAGAEAPRSSSPAALAAEGPRAEGRREEYELLVEAIYEGYLLHYGSSRVLLAPEADVGVLAGDRLYAIGLERLVALGDAEAVAELADTITLSALAQGAGEGELADVIWEAGARAVGWGTSSEHEHAKALVLEGSAEALDAMRTSAAGLPRAR
jgi:hypothetical protein